MYNYIHSFHSFNLIFFGKFSDFQSLFVTRVLCYYTMISTDLINFEDYTGILITSQAEKFIFLLNLKETLYICLSICLQL